MPLHISIDKRSERPAMNNKGSITIVPKGQERAREQNDESPCVLVACVPEGVTTADLKEVVFVDFKDQIRGFKKITDDSYLVFVQSKDDAVHLAGKYHAAELEGQTIYCYPMLKLRPQKKLEIKLKG